MYNRQQKGHLTLTIAVLNGTICRGFISKTTKVIMAFVVNFMLTTYVISFYINIFANKHYVFYKCTSLYTFYGTHKYNFNDLFYKHSSSAIRNK